MKREMRIGQLKCRPEATASRLYMATVGKEDAEAKWDPTEEMKKWYKPKEIEELLSWKGQFEDPEMDELENTTDGSRASELVGKLIRRVAMMAGELI